jgi:hypothetical protein
MLQTPFLDLTEKHEGGLPSFLVLNRHPEKSDAQFVGRARALPPFNPPSLPSDTAAGFFSGSSGFCT